MSSAGPFRTSLAHGLQLVTGHGDVFLPGLQRGQSFGSHRTRGSHLPLRRCGPSCDLRRSRPQLSAFWDPCSRGDGGERPSSSRSHAAGRGAERLICSFPQRAGGSEPEAWAVVAKVFSRQKQTGSGVRLASPPRPRLQALQRPGHHPPPKAGSLCSWQGAPRVGLPPVGGATFFASFHFLNFVFISGWGRFLGTASLGQGTDSWGSVSNCVFSAEVRQDASSREG